MSESLKSKTAKALVWKFAERGLYQVVAFAVQVVLVRLLAPEQFGAMAIMQVFLALSNSLVQSGLSNALVRAERVSERDYTAVLNLSFLMALALYLAVFLIAPFAADFYAIEELSAELRVLALVLFVNAFQSVQVARANRELKTKSIMKSTLAGSLVSGAVAIALAAVGMNAWALVCQTMLMQVVCCISLRIIEGWSPRIGLGLKEARKFWAFGWKIAASGLVFNAYQNVFDLVVGKALSAHALGLFSQGRKIPYIIFNSFDGSIQTVMLSSLSKVQDDRERFVRVLRRMVKTGVLVVAPIMLFVASSAGCLVPLVFGQEWASSAPVVTAFAIGYSLSSVSSSNQQALNALGRSDIFLKLEVAKAVVGLSVFGAVLLASGEVVVIACGAGFVLLLATAINSIPVKRLTGYGYRAQIKDVVSTYISACLSAALSFAAGLLCEGLLVSFCVQCAVMFASYIVVLWATKNEPASYVWRHIRKRKATSP